MTEWSSDLPKVWSFSLTKEILRTVSRTGASTDQNFSIDCRYFLKKRNPMDTSSSIRNQFDVEIPRGKFVEITSILKDESPWKLWHRFDVGISTWIRLSKSTKYRWVLHMDFYMSFRRQIDLTSVLAVSILSFSNIFCSGNLF